MDTDSETEIRFRKPLASVFIRVCKFPVPFQHRSLA